MNMRRIGFRNTRRLTYPRQRPLNRARVRRLAHPSVASLRAPARELIVLLNNVIRSHKRLERLYPGCFDYGGRERIQQLKYDEQQILVRAALDKIYGPDTPSSLGGED